MNRHHPSATFPPHRRAAWLLLLVFLFGHTPLLPAISGLVAGLDGSHTQQFSFTRGGVQLTLHHQDKDLAAGNHAHSAWLSVLTTFTHDSGPGHSDHTIAFATGSSADVTRNAAAGAAGFTSAPPSCIVLAVLPAPYLKHGSDDGPPPGTDSGPPPLLHARLKTVQLII